jgi:hypothetical protein
MAPFCASFWGHFWSPGGHYATFLDDGVLEMVHLFRSFLNIYVHIHINVGKVEGGKTGVGKSVCSWDWVALWVGESFDCCEQSTKTHAQDADNTNTGVHLYTWQLWLVR